MCVCSSVPCVQNGRNGMHIARLRETVPVIVAVALASFFAGVQKAFQKQPEKSQGSRLGDLLLDFLVWLYLGSRQSSPKLRRWQEQGWALLFIYFSSLLFVKLLATR